MGADVAKRHDDVDIGVIQEPIQPGLDARERPISLHLRCGRECDLEVDLEQLDKLLPDKSGRGAPPDRRDRR